MDTVISNSADILILLVLVAAIAVLYALRKKGDVIATLSFLPFTFTLQAKDRRDKHGGNRKSNHRRN